MTYQFFKTMMRFCFPEKDPESLDSGSTGDQEHSISEGTASGTGTLGVRKGAKHLATKHKRSKESSFYVPIDDKDDVEKMKVRLNEGLVNCHNLLSWHFVLLAYFAYLL